MDEVSSGNREKLFNKELLLHWIRMEQCFEVIVAFVKRWLI